LAFLLSIVLALACADVAAADHDPPNTPPSNDTCDMAVRIALNSTLEGQDNLGASAGDCEDETDVCGSSPYGHTVWYVFTVTSKGTVTVSTSGLSVPRASNLDTVIAIYPPSGPQIACNDEGGAAVGGSRLSLDLQPGDYYVVVGGFDYFLTTGPDYGFFSITLSYTEDLDRDDDGYPRPRDCMDDNPAVHPNAPDTNNGIDDDCDGVIDPNKDGDPYGRPQDCDDNNPRIYPGAPEVRGNNVDEDCDGIKDAFQRIQVSPRLIGFPGPVFEFSGIEVANVPKGARVRVTCKHGRRSCGSASKVRRRRAGLVAIHGLHKVIQPGSRITILVTKSHWIGYITRYTIRRNKRPARFDHCVNEGETKPPRGRCQGIRR
jgi:hypothetical protein